MATHELDTTVDTCHWGYYDAALAPVMTIASGDTLVVKTESGRKDFLQKHPERVSDNLRRILETMEQGPGAHIMTGPVAVEGAEPGDVLEIKMRDIRPRYDWGYNGFRPLMGGLPEDFPYTRVVIVEGGRGEWNGRLRARASRWPLGPFFGNFGVAPAPALGRVPSSPPERVGRQYGL